MVKVLTGKSLNWKMTWDEKIILFSLVLKYGCAKTKNNPDKQFKNPEHQILRQKLKLIFNSKLIYLFPFALKIPVLTSFK